MTTTRLLRSAAALAIASILATIPTMAQTAEKYSVRLSNVPVANANARNNIDGNPLKPADGTASATLTGRKLTINGTFQDLKTAATIAQVHQSQAMGMRGPVVFDLMVTKADKGSFTGSFDLTPEQLELLRKSRLYIQIHCESAPEGALWGWLVK
jgi:hypothetical protein